MRDVAAHLTLASRARPLEAALGVLRHRGSVNGWVAAEAIERGRQAPAELVAALREVAASRHHPPGTKAVDPLVDVLVHTQDIALPLDIAHDAADRAAAVAAADRIWSMSFPFFARRRLRGLHLRATDVEWQRGTGPDLVAGTITALLPVLAGRRGRSLDPLHGPGKASLSQASDRRP